MAQGRNDDALDLLERDGVRGAGIEFVVLAATLAAQRDAATMIRRVGQRVRTVPAAQPGLGGDTTVLAQTPAPVLGATRTCPARF
jgi:hypothetical protein